MIKLYFLLLSLVLTLGLVSCASQERVPSSTPADPRPLLALIPAGANQATFLGQTRDGKKCKIELSAKAGFSAGIVVYDANDQFNSKRSPNFQTTFGHTLTEVKTEQNVIQAISFAPAGQQYSSNQRAIFMARKNDQLEAVVIQNESEGFFGWKKEIDEACVIKK